MFDKAFRASQSFYHTCRYVCQDITRAEVLYQQGVRGNDYRQMARDFEVIHQLHPSRNKPVFHGVLDFLPAEKQEDAKMMEMAQKYLAHLGYSDAQYVITKHIDKPHVHVHMIANRIDLKGNYVSDSWDTLRQMEVAEALIKEYKLLQPSQKKNLQQTNLAKLYGSPANRYAIYQAIRETLPNVRNLDQLEEGLLRLRVETNYKLDEQTGLRRGISFRYNNEAFKGSKIDRAFSLRGLEKALALQLSPWEEAQLKSQEEQKHSLTQSAEITPAVSQRPELQPAIKPRQQHSLRIS